MPILHRNYNPDSVDCSQCLDCGSVFDGNQFDNCPTCKSERVVNGLDIETTFYQNYYSADREKIDRQIRYYRDAMANGIILVVS